MLFRSVAAVDEGVAGGEQRLEHRDGGGDVRGGHHQPDVPWHSEGGNDLLWRASTTEALALHCHDGRLVHVVGNALVTGALQATDHVGAHAPQPNHCDLHAHKVARFAVGYRQCTMTDLQRSMRGATAAHALLLGALRELDDGTCAGPSLLPGWSVGHVLTHLARNADSHVVMLRAANRGEVAAQYPGGAAQRSADIDAGAAHPAAAQLADLAAASDRLEATWTAMTDDGWQGVGEAFAGSVPVRDLPFRRWREVTLHHSDLGIGFDCCDWPPEYVRLELGRMTMQWASRKPMGLTTLPPAAVALPDAQRVAWLTGRLVVDGLDPAGIF